MRLTLTLAALCLATAAFAGKDHAHPTPQIAPEFEKMKGLVGTWEGMSKMNGKEEKHTVTYEMTSGGTAIVEKLGSGTPYEMITVYATRGGHVQATHYCMVGNQPEMKLKKTDGTTFTFEMDGAKGITNKNEMHMHGVILALNGNKLKQEWTNFKDGKKDETAIFEFTKTK